MGRLIEIADVRIRTVDRQRILHQVVRAEAEERQMLQQFLRQHRRRGDFDHAADVHLVVEIDMVAFQFGFHFVENAQRLLELLQRADHREHDANFAERARPEDRPQLRLENGRLAQ